jgi:hypothetical protein
MANKLFWHISAYFTSIIKLRSKVQHQPGLMLQHQTIAGFCA